MTSLEDAILSVFIERHQREFKDSEIANFLNGKKFDCDSDAIRRHAQVLSPALFQIIYNSDKSVSIRVNPIIEICEEYLTTRCSAPGRTCKKLHICRHIDSCQRPNCNFPHDFTREPNRSIVNNHNCARINPVILVKFLRLSKNHSRPRARKRGGRGRNNRDRRGLVRETSRQSLDQINCEDRKVDVCFPSSKINKQLDINDIRMLLDFKGIKIQSTFDDNENEYCHRTTLQLQSVDDVNKLVKEPISIHQGIHIKYKRTKQEVDRTSFVLKNSINGQHDKIDLLPIRRFLNLLIGRDNTFTLFDITLDDDDEQVTLVQSQMDLDFNKILQGNRANPQLAGRNISVNQIYQYDALKIIRNNKTDTITFDDLEHMFRHCWRDVFSYHFPSTNTAEIEFINSIAAKNIMSNKQSITSKFKLTISPIVDFIDDENSDACSHVSSQHEDQLPTETTIKLRDDWAIIAAHGKFKLQYKEFIKKNLGGDIQTNDNKATYTGTFPVHLQDTPNDQIVYDKTNEFMKQFRSETFNQLQQQQIDILRDCKDTVAFSRKQGNDYLVAMKANDMNQFKLKLFNQTTQSDRNSMRITVAHLINKPEYIQIFKINSFDDRLKQYIETNFHVTITFETTGNTKANIRAKITGLEDDVENGLQELKDIFSLLNTKKFNDKDDGNWTRIDGAVRVIQYYFDQFSLICACCRTSSNEISVYYFDIRQEQFGTADERIDHLIQSEFRTATVPLPEDNTSKQLVKEWADFEDKIRRRNDYEKRICFDKDSKMLYLFGTGELIKELQQKLSSLKQKFDAQPCQVTLSARQLKYLFYVGKSEMIKLENRYKTLGYEINLDRLHDQSKFFAPEEIHEKIKGDIEALAQICETTFEISKPGFELFVRKDFDQIVNLIKSKCCFEKLIDKQQEQIAIPIARSNNNENVVKSTTVSIENIKTINVGQSKISVTFGDLTAQQVDAIIVSPSSQILCEKITHEAGSDIEEAYFRFKDENNFPNVTFGGKLACKQIFFIHWSPKSRTEGDVVLAFKSFISQAFLIANDYKCKSLAFPAVGCGGFGFDLNMIAKCMLQETKIELKAQERKMNISFILLKNQQNVYDAFVKYLNELEIIDLSISHKTIVKKEDNNRLTIPFERRIVKFVLISSNESHLAKSKDDILKLAEKHSINRQITNQDLNDWSQEDIYQYYKFCLDRRVMPTMDLDKGTIDLQGLRDEVHEAETHFYKQASGVHNALRLKAVSKGIIWSFELVPNTNEWEQYSFKLISLIEDAYSKHLEIMNFSNEKDEDCSIRFLNMQEICGGKIRRIRRTERNSTLPETWEPMQQNCKRITLSSTSIEYKKVLAQFNETMLNRYSQIVKIEQIQNERWYKQYAAHREDFRQRYATLDERLLFHGCPSTSADQIIEACFNRSFAGVNGVVYGCGVYFHAQATYSHQYASVNPAGERTMFLASVLIGRTIKGDKSMKVPPAGYDTTTDGQHIFVVYHDAGAYADYLITYKGK